jgi:hypothetical protein
MLTHGWPGSVAEFAKVIGVNPPTADAFRGRPSLPGSGSPASHGARLGHSADRRRADEQAGLQAVRRARRGAIISAGLGEVHGDRLIGLRLTMPGPLRASTDAPTRRTPASRRPSRRRWYGLAPGRAGAWIWRVPGWTDCDGRRAIDATCSITIYWATAFGRIYWRATASRFARDSADGNRRVPQGVLRVTPGALHHRALDRRLAAATSRSRTAGLWSTTSGGGPRLASAQRSRKGWTGSTVVCALGHGVVHRG